MKSNHQLHLKPCETVCLQPRVLNTVAYFGNKYG